jgi:hypothetical protein
LISTSRMMPSFIFLIINYCHNHARILVFNKSSKKKHSLVGIYRGFNAI